MSAQLGSAVFTKSDWEAFRNLSGKYYDEEIAPLFKQQEALKEKMNELNIREAQVDQKIQAASQKVQAASQKAEAASQKVKELTTVRQILVAKQFYGIFSKNSLNDEKFIEIFKTYLADNNSLSFEKSGEGESYPQINSMKAVTKFLTHHPEFKTCDFRVFKDKISDIPTLTEFLITSQIKGVAMKNGISQEAKDSLAKAVTVRNGGLKVQYFA